MSRPVAVKVGSRAAVTLNAQSIIVIVFLILLVYILFSGSDGKKPRVDQQEHTSIHSEHGPESFITQVQDTNRKGEDVVEGWYETAQKRPLRPDAPHTPITRNGRSSDRRKTVSFGSNPDTNPTVNTTSDATTEAGIVEKPYVRPPEYRSKVRKAPPPNSLMGLLLHPDISERRKFFSGAKLPEHILSRINELEQKVDQDCRGRTSASIRPDDKDDPLRDGWPDPVLGIFPTIGLDAAHLVAAGIREPDINQFADLVINTAKQGDIFDGFLRRVAPNDGGKISPERLAIGWFADTYRNIPTEERMSMKKMFPIIHAQLPTMAILLGWLEGYSRRLWRQRVVSTGVDLDGCALRLTIPTKLDTTSTVSTTPVYRYEMQLHVFLWGGPISEGKDPYDDWIQRISHGRQSLLTAYKEIVTMWPNLNEPADALTSKVDARRVFFRPGYTTLGIANASNNGKVEQGLSNLSTMSRKSTAVVYPSDVWSAFPTGKRLLTRSAFDFYMWQILGLVSPEDAACCDLRQHQWSRDTLTKDNNQLSSVQLLAALRAVSISMDFSSDASGTVQTHSMKTLDLGGCIPLVKNTDNNGVRFFPLDGFRSLTCIILPCIFQSADCPSTAELLVNQEYGLERYLTRREPDMIARDPVFFRVTCRNEVEVDEFRQHMIKLAWPTATDMISAGTREAGTDRERINKVRRLGRKAIFGWLKHVFVINLASSQGGFTRMNQAGSPVHEGSITWPEEFVELG